MRALQRVFGILVTFVMFMGLAVAPAGAQAATPDLGGILAFEETWVRPDYPVADGRVSRTYYYGPETLLKCTTGDSREEYREAAGGRRPVLYLDKARLELTRPEQVTAGLLAKELISGEMQFGDAEFRQYDAAQVPVAGDTNATNAPTYASFKGVTSINPDQNRAENRVNQMVTQTINRAGQVSNDASLARYNVRLVDYRGELGHNIPNVFMDFFNQRGLVAERVGTGLQLQVEYRGEEVLIDWVQVMGLPVAEPYWAVVPVGGVEKWVLMQPFERRIVTYTPDNDPAFQVEMGNIGLHYKIWRHPDGTCADRQAAPGITVPDGKNATVAKKVGPWGTIFRLTITGFQPGEPISFWLTTPDGMVAGTPAPVNAGNHNGTLRDEWATNQGWPPGLWAVTYQGDRSGHQAIAYFYVTDRPAPPAPPQVVPDGRNGTVTPKHGWQGTIFRININGFRANEPISFWITAPDGSVVGTPRPVGGQHNGSIQGFTLRTNEAFPPGLWAVTFQGDTTGHQAIVYLYILQ